jgi:hypothetical protein
MIHLAACLRAFAGAALLVGLGEPQASAQLALPHYFAHEAVEDRYGVIAPWYHGLNGQCDFRVRIAAETLKRYPWTREPKTGRPAPAYIYNGLWGIQADGTIQVKPLNDWHNGDLVQRNAYALLGLVDYYRYSGDPAALAHMSLIADVVLSHCQTDALHPWPRFLISVPSRGEPYGMASPRGMIQLDLVGLFGLALVRAYEVTGNSEWLDAAAHWGDVLAEKCSHQPGTPPWNRYANPMDVPWNDLQTGGVVMILNFLDELIRVGRPGKNGAMAQAQAAGRAYLREVLLPRWLEHDTWGREYWDWEHQVQGESYSEMVPRYLMAHPELFPNWRAEARNIASLYLQRASVATNSNGDVYSGAWAYPEGSQCCGRSLSYAPMQVGAAFAEYGVRADSAWGRELARRQFLLATYDCLETGVVEDGMDGGPVVAGGWFQIAHPLPLKYVLDAMAWLPGPLGPNRENHILRTSAVVSCVHYGAGRLAYATFDAPANTVELLRLAFRPVRITADNRRLKEWPALNGNGYLCESLLNGDWLLTIRHDGRRSVVVEGPDPQQLLDDRLLEWSGSWAVQKTSSGALLHVSAETNAAMTCSFEGNQVRLLGSVAPDGGLAEVWLDGVKQLCGIDFWNPSLRAGQLVFYRNGLAQGRHRLKVVALGQGNPLSSGAQVGVQSVEVSAATGDAGFGEGGGPTGTQRWVFGYPSRFDYTDSAGQVWRPATEAVIRAGRLADSVQASWHTEPRRQAVAGTADPALYAYGMHGKDFTTYFTVAPGAYHVRVKLMETRLVDPEDRKLNIDINGQPAVRNLDIAATAAGAVGSPVSVGAKETRFSPGMNTAVDLVFNDITPRHGVIAVRFTGGNKAEAIVSALEVGPGAGGSGATPR